MKVSSGERLAFLIVIAFALSFVGGLVEGAWGHRPFPMIIGRLLSQAAPFVGFLALGYALWAIL
jgi:hypothetical protein